MLNNKKFFFIAGINLIAISIFFLWPKMEESSVFNTDFVLKILDKNKILTEKNTELEENVLLMQQSLFKQENTVREVNSALESLKLNPITCAQDQNHLNELRLLEINAKECEANLQTLATSEQKVIQLQRMVNELTLEKQKLIAEKADLANMIASVEKVDTEVNTTDKTVTDVVTSDVVNKPLVNEQALSNPITDVELVKAEATINALKEAMQGLKDDLSRPLYIKSFFATPFYCEASGFESRVCLNKVLVRTQFSKAPLTSVIATLFGPDGRKVAEVDYSAAMAQLVEFRFESRRDFAAGDYYVEYAVDNTTYTSNTFLLSQ